MSISGGTNALSKELCIKTNVRVNGIAIGTYARDIIEKYIYKENFLDCNEDIYSAYVIAKQLVRVSNNDQ